MTRPHRPGSKHYRLAIAAALAGALAGPAASQILPGGVPGALPGGLPSIGLPDISRPASRIGELPAQVRAPVASVLQQARALRLAALVRDNPTFIDTDERGAPVVRGEVLALSPSPDAVVRLQAVGFRVRESAEDDALGIGLLVLEPPPSLSIRDAIRQVRTIDQQGAYEFNHIYLEAGAATGGAALRSTAAGAQVGLLDGGVDPKHPALRAADVVQRSFAPGGVRPRAHGLAVAALLAGEQGRFRGAAPGAKLYVADVYGTTPAGGSAASLAQALGWMASAKVGVINVSLVGPPNLVLEAAVRAMNARGHLIVAAVGNDGPAAPPLYPAAYPGVIAVTAVDGRRRLLPEAGRPLRIDFAAPGADMAAPGANGGFVVVRGTSFAAPIVAGRLALDLPAPDRVAAARALASLAGAAQDLGAKGPDERYGKGLVGFDLVTRPAAVAAKGMLTAP